MWAACGHFFKCTADVEEILQVSGRIVPMQCVRIWLTSKTFFIGSEVCESFTRRTFTTPKIRTFTTPQIGHFPPPKKTFARRTTANPNFFSFFGALFLAFSTYSSWRTSRMGRRRCLMRWSWSTSSRGCVTRWSWSTSSRRCLTCWSWSTSSRGRRWKRSPRW